MSEFRGTFRGHHILCNFYMSPSDGCEQCAMLRAKDAAPSPAPTPPSSQAGDWPEDAAHENGQYSNRCAKCGATFTGHKRRVVCKVCAFPTVAPDTGAAASGVPAPVATPARIYVASRVSRADVWHQLRAEGYPIISTWIDEAGEGETGDFGELWERIRREISASTGLLFLGDPDDAPWKGALVEAGMAMAFNKPIAAAINRPLEGRTQRPVGSWVLSNRVKLFDDVRKAADYLAARSAGQIHTGRESASQNVACAMCEGYGIMWSNKTLLAVPCPDCHGSGRSPTTRPERQNNE